MNTNSFYRSGFKVDIEQPEPIPEPPEICVLTYMNLRGKEDLGLVYRKMKNRFRQAPGYLVSYRPHPCAAVFRTVDDAAELLKQLAKEGYPRYEFQLFYPEE